METDPQIFRVTEAPESSAEVLVIGANLSTKSYLSEAAEVYGVPIGTIIDYGGDVPPDNSWEICDGGELDRVIEAELFAVTGTRYGVGNGTTTFNKPPAAVFNLGPGGGRNIGDRGGEATHVLTAAEMPSHTHTSTTMSPVAGVFMTAAAQAWNQAATNTGAAGGGGAHNNMPPYVVNNRLIKTRKI